MTSGPLDPTNPFAAPSSLPYGLPDFAAIREEHYLPAFLAGTAEQRAEVAAIAGDPQAPTVENTLVAFERTGRLLDRVSAVFYNQLSSDATPGLESIEEEVAPLLAAHHDAIWLDRALAARVEELGRQADEGTLDLEPDTAWLLHRRRIAHRRAGAGLPDEAQARLRAVNERLTTLEATFGRTLLAATNAAAVLVTDEDELDGLPQDAKAAAATAAERHGEAGAWLIDLVLPTDQPVLAHLRHRGLRRRVFEASATRGLGGEHDTRPILVEIAALRAERARILGYAHHADYVASDLTIHGAQAVADLLGGLVGPALANARAEAVPLQSSLEREEPGAVLEPWDWSYYAQQVRRERRSLDESAMRPYLELDRVVTEGVFRAANLLFGLTFAHRHDLRGYHRDVRVYEVFDADGTGRALFLHDPWTRDSKRGGAWMNNLVDQSSLLGEQCVVVNNLNIPKPPDGEPTLLTWDEVTTLFHEFGHALHAIFSDVRYPTQSGTAVPRDAVEYPSQVNEMWAWEPEVLRGFAVHHVTGEPMPAVWVQTLLDARQDGEGFATTEYLGAALLDQAWHRLAPDEVPASPGDVEAFEHAALEKAGIAYPAVPPRYRSTYFNHVFSGGYSAGYYSYIWSEVLDADTVTWYAEHGGLRRENGDEFRAKVLSRGGSLDALEAFEDLRGRAPDIAPLLARRGLSGSPVA
ncbi:MAG TPA: M3 family metallopeptidase [Cellulomonas sp.]